MSSIFNKDFLEFIHCLDKHNVEYIIVGGYSVILHGYSRSTGDLDLWIGRTKKNYKNLVNAFHEFGMPIFDMTEENFLYREDIDVFTFGRPPVAIDIMTSVKGLDFKKCYKESVITKTGDIELRILSLENLIISKKASGRHKDQDDIEHLTDG